MRTLLISLLLCHVVATPLQAQSNSTVSASASAADIVAVEGAVKHLRSLIRQGDRDIINDCARNWDQHGITVSSIEGSCFSFVAFIVKEKRERLQTCERALLLKKLLSIRQVTPGMTPEDMRLIADTDGKYCMQWATKK